MQLHAIPAFQDNYIWLLADADGRCLVVDPGDPDPVAHFIARHRLSLSAILITHHHADHTGGIKALLARWPVPVYGPAHERIAGVDHPLHEGDSVRLDTPAIRLRVLELPGHTLGHIGYFCEDHHPPLLFCGDTLFSGGCGRLFEGTPEQLSHSLGRLARLPDNTLVCCTHEYTQANLRFAGHVLPGDPAIEARINAVKALRDAGKPSLPSDIATEKAHNPFLRVDEPALVQALEKQFGEAFTEHVQRFAALRRWKDSF